MLTNKVGLVSTASGGHRTACFCLTGWFVDGILLNPFLPLALKRSSGRRPKRDGSAPGGKDGGTHHAGNNDSVCFQGELAVAQHGS